LSSFIAGRRNNARVLEGRAMKRAVGIAAICLMSLLPSPASAKDDLVIGVAQFPSSLHQDTERGDVCNG
jgi:hypothetical protein